MSEPKKPMIARKDGPPTANFILGGIATKLSACQRSVYVIESLTGQSMQEYMTSLLGPGPISRFYPLLWGLTSTYRAEGGRDHTITPADRDLGLLVPSSFVHTLPVGPDWSKLTELADSLIAAAWSDPEEDLSPDPPAQSSDPPP